MGAPSRKAATEAAFAAPPQGGRPKGPTEVFSAPSNVGLLFTTGPLAGRQFPLGGMGVVIGRDDTAQIVVEDGQVSGKHVWIGYMGQRLIARDMGSTNGTFVNGRMNERITEVELRSGDELTLGARGSVKLSIRF
jgi:hypothetical protein